MWFSATRLLCAVPPLAACTIAIGLAVPVLQSGWLAERIDRQADFILRGGRSEPAILAALHTAAEKTDLDKACNSDVLRNMSILQVKQVELAGPFRDEAVRKKNVDLIRRAEAGVKRTLACTPTDGFLWYALGWLTYLAGDAEDATYGFMRMSYKTAPREAWVALRRNAFMVTQIDHLSTDMADTVIAEFGSLVENGFYNEALGILTGPGWQFRERLVGGLSGVKSPRLSIFVRLLQTHNVGLDIPGTPPAERRPWN